MRTKDKDMYLKFYYEFRYRCTNTNITKDFKILHLIGTGAFSTVHKAISTRRDEEYSIKIIVKEKLLTEKNGRAGFINEINILRILDHPNIIKFHRTYED